MSKTSRIKIIRPTFVLRALLAFTCAELALTGSPLCTAQAQTQAQAPVQAQAQAPQTQAQPKAQDQTQAPAPSTIQSALSAPASVTSSSPTVAPATQNSIAPAALEVGKLISETAAEPSEKIFSEEALRDNRVQAVVTTSLGSFTVRLFTREIPQNTENFIRLAMGQKVFTDFTGRKVRRPFYNGLQVFQNIENFVIKTGCPMNNGTGGPGFQIPDEIRDYPNFSESGMVAISNYGKDTGGSQFFITLRPAPELQGKYTIIGKIISGRDVVKKLGTVPVSGIGRPLEALTIDQIELVERQPAAVSN